jgi:di/tricarboxylate transporter
MSVAGEGRSSGQRRAVAPMRTRTLQGMERGIGTLIIVIGVVIVLIGVLVSTGALNWFGRLPGDVRFESGSTRVFLPITSMVIASVVLTLVVNVVLRFMR